MISPPPVNRRKGISTRGLTNVSITSDMNDVDSTYQLVQVIKRHPTLYDSDNVDYHVKHRQEAAWEKVSKEVNAPVICCKEKWTNLRAAFSRHMRNVVSAELGAKPKKPYYMAKHMEFLKPFTKQKLLQTRNVNFVKLDLGKHEVAEPSENSREIKIEECFELSVDDTLATIYHPSIEVDPLQTESASQSEVADEKEVDVTEPTAKKKRLQEDDASTSEMDRAPQNYDEYNDPDLNFLKSLLPDIRLMKRRQKNKFKISMINVIDNILNDE